MKNSLYLNSLCLQQRSGNAGAGQAHDALLRRTEAEEIDAAIPDDVAVHDGVFLVDALAAGDLNAQIL